MKTGGKKCLTIFCQHIKIKKLKKRKKEIKFKISSGGTKVTKAKDVILRILQKAKMLPTFHLAKLTYLFDLAYIQLFGKTDTSLPYEWGYYGPYCKDFENAVWELEKEKKISRQGYTTRKNYDCVLHSAATQTPPPLNHDEEELLSYIIKKYAKMTTDDLRDFVYKTSPMIDAQKNKSRFERLNMRFVSRNKKIIIDRDIAKMILSAEKLEDKDYVTSAEILGRIKKYIDSQKSIRHAV